MFCLVFFLVWSNNSHIFTLCLSRGMLAHIISKVLKHYEADLIPALGITLGLVDEALCCNYDHCSNLRWTWGGRAEDGGYFPFTSPYGEASWRLICPPACRAHVQSPGMPSWHKGRAYKMTTKPAERASSLAVDEKKRFLHTTHISGIHTYKTRRSLWY